jgi:hypothetical protein
MTDLNQKIMKTIGRSWYFVNIIAFCVLFMYGLTEVQAQDRGNYDKGGNRHSEVKIGRAHV